MMRQACVANRLAGVSLLVFLLAPSAAMAQGAAVRQTCGPEIQQHCAGVQPGDGRLRACVKQHFAHFSEPCRQVLLSGVAVVKACKADVQRTCPDVQPGGGRIQACMKEHFAEYSEPCQQAIIMAKFGKR
jgi:Cysteine rich repeat